MYRFCTIIKSKNCKLNRCESGNMVIFELIQLSQGRLGGAVGWASDFSQVTISRSGSSSPASGSGLMAQSLEPVSDSVSPSLSAPPPFMHCLSLSQK